MFHIQIGDDHHISYADIQGVANEILADLGIAVNQTIELIADEENSKEEILNELTRLLKTYWETSDNEGNQ